MTTEAADVLKTVGAGVRRWRQKSRLTIAQLAERAGIDTGFLAYIENGKKGPSIQTLAKLAGALGVTVGDLFSANGSSIGTPRGRLLREAHSLCHGCPPHLLADLRSVLSKLRDPEKVKAILKLCR